MHYHDSQDHRHTRDLLQEAPVAAKAFTEFDQAVFGETDALPALTKELIAIGVAATTQCPYCMEAHVSAAKRAGATRAQVAEAVMVAAALRAGGAFTHGWLAMKAYGD
ncbi:carboxymuconolactone decarboxylase family protein [Aeromicrobium sp. YIM 150415]|uniref:carboxymuconolactone decarboxylase family protein n=1 Tax=Aeromicrobium sp. YIM 150415 TaxID=2803912 RepID=UPI0019658C91|nr:carboxymuconolactone decarboxylase family protein [Aeromicrobium sp. YIM 150415]MBM9463479.1 carboxymuconolactone decarboxylase family protein [Aeromicrobium sp. YIM 150415]